MSRVSRALREFVASRAKHRCEYCQLAQSGQEATFHVDHVMPRVAGGATHHNNLALARVSCSLFKEARRSGIDPSSGRRVRLFHPRKQKWSDHFEWDGAALIGLTATARATIALLRLNRAILIAIRQEEELRGRHPPDNPT